MSTSQDNLLQNKQNMPPSWKTWIAGGINPILWAIFELVPLLFGLHWIPGWPKAYMYLIAFIISIPVIWCLFGRRPMPGLSEKQKLIRYAAAAAGLVVMAVLSISRGFSSYPKTVEYMHSPNRANTAVVLEEPNVLYKLKGLMPWEPETNKTVYPVRAWVFYEKKQGQGLIASRESMEQSYRWIDDDTLEFVTTFVTSEMDPIAEYIKW